MKASTTKWWILMMAVTSRPLCSIYRRYAIVAEADLREAGVKLSALADSVQKGQATT
jgi:hypothetical protein